LKEINFMAHLLPRITEAQIDALFARNLGRLGFASAFLSLARVRGRIAKVIPQHRHPMGRGIKSGSLLLAPQAYLSASRDGAMFDRHVSYKACLLYLEGDDHTCLAAAIAQAGRPYEPEPDQASGDFFSAFRAHVSAYYPQLVLKREPNGNGVRPTGSRTFYFEAARTLRLHQGLPKPKMSLQAWDSGAPSSSVKIMLGGLAAQTERVAVPDGLRAIGG
jgi:hypothetical protein